MKKYAVFIDHGFLVGIWEYENLSELETLAKHLEYNSLQELKQVNGVSLVTVLESEIERIETTEKKR